MAACMAPCMALAEASGGTSFPYVHSCSVSIIYHPFLLLVLSLCIPSLVCVVQICDEAREYDFFHLPRERLVLCLANPMGIP